MKVIEIVPQPAPRPRFSKFGTYNTAKYTNYKKALSLLLKQQNKVMLEGAVELYIVFYMQIPASYSNKKRNSLINKHHIKKPDTDNLLKAFLDASNEVIFKDDSLVSKITAVKMYSLSPRIEYEFSNLC